MARRPRNPFANAQIAPYRVRRALAPPVELKPNTVRLVLLSAIKAGQVKPGQGQYVGGWRWDGVTVTNRVNQLANAEWIKIHDAPKRRLEVLELGDRILATRSRTEGETP